MSTGRPATPRTRSQTCHIGGDAVKDGTRPCGRTRPPSAFIGRRSAGVRPREPAKAVAGAVLAGFVVGLDPHPQVSSADARARRPTKGRLRRRGRQSGADSEIRRQTTFARGWNWHSIEAREAGHSLSGWQSASPRPWPACAWLSLRRGSSDGGDRRRQRRRSGLGLGAWRHRARCMGWAHSYSAWSFGGGSARGSSLSPANSFTRRNNGFTRQEPARPPAERANGAQSTTPWSTGGGGWTWGRDFGPIQALGHGGCGGRFSGRALAAAAPGPCPPPRRPFRSAPVGHGAPHGPDPGPARIVSVFCRQRSGPAPGPPDADSQSPDPPTP